MLSPPTTAINAVAPPGGCIDRSKCMNTINGVELLDSTEPDETIPLKGMIALQIHGGLKGTIRYRNLRITELPAPRP